MYGCALPTVKLWLRHCMRYAINILYSYIMHAAKSFADNLSICSYVGAITYEAFIYLLLFF